MGGRRPLDCGTGRRGPASHDGFFYEYRLVRGAGRIVHTLRAAYGWTDATIYDGIREYGVAWLEEAFRNCLEDQADERRWLLACLPIARTPMDRQSGSRLQKYSRHLSKLIDQLTPWQKEERKKRIRARLKAPPQNLPPVQME